MSNKDDDYMNAARDKEPVPVVLGGSSPIQVRFIGWLVIVCAGGFGGWIWWASAMSTKLDIVIANQSAQLTMVKNVSDEVARLKEWRIQIDTVGSASAVELHNKLDELTKAFALHLATNKP